MADKTVIPREDFTAYPYGTKVEFRTGVPEKVPAKYAELLRRKGHLRPPRKADVDSD